MARIIILLFMTVFVGACDMFETYEEPRFTVTKSDPPFEIRKYESFIQASVVTKGERAAAADEAFRKLAGYIFGGNQPKESMAMTVPVTQQKVADGWTMQFVMPSSRTLDNLPRPNSPDITFIKQPAKKMAVVVFSGFHSSENLEKHVQMLRDYAVREKLTLKGDPVYAFYNSPFSLPFMRRNEIMFAVE